MHHPSYRHEFPNFPPRVRARERSTEERDRARSVEIERWRRLSGKEAEPLETEDKQRTWLVPPLPHTTVSNFYRKAQSRQSRKAEKKAAVSHCLNTSSKSGQDSPKDLSWVTIRQVKKVNSKVFGSLGLNINQR